MASAQSVLLSPAELAYLHTSLSLTPPVRPDGRRARQFRALSAETDILSSANGSARVCFADGTEAIVGVKAEIEKTVTILDDGFILPAGADPTGDDAPLSVPGLRPPLPPQQQQRRSSSKWVEMSVEIPGLRDDEPATAYLAAMLNEALLADGEFTDKLYINPRFHWRLYLDVLLISPPLSYPLPLLSLTTHLALLSTRLPRLKSEGDEDPMFDDDWEASRYLFPREGGDGDGAGAGSDHGTDTKEDSSRPPITLLLAAIGDNIIFDPSKEELAVAETVLAVSVSEVRPWGRDRAVGKRVLRLRAVRTVDPPSRLTAPGVPSGTAGAAAAAGAMRRENGPAVDDMERPEGLWRAPAGGTKLAMLERMITAVMESGGGADEVLDGLENVGLD